MGVSPEISRPLVSFTSWNTSSSRSTVVMAAKGVKSSRWLPCTERVADDSFR